MAVHMRNGIQYGGIPNGTVKGVNPSTVPTTVKQLNQIGTVGNIAPVTIPSAVKFSNGDTLETAIGSVATIETSPAVAAHDAGEYIFYNGQMYKVIAAIAVGETLTDGTNISARNVGEELTALNNGLSHKQNTLTITSLTSTAVGSGVTINSQSLALYGKVLQFSIDVTLASQISQYGSLVSLGGKSAAAGWCHPLFSAGFVPSSQYAIYGDIGNQNIRSAQTLPAGRYLLIGMILTT